MEGGGLVFRIYVIQHNSSHGHVTPPARYSETQTAPNGLRYRDWVCVYASDTRLEKCKLEAHILDINQVHQSMVPWHRHTPGTTSTDKPSMEYVMVRSSLPLEQRVLHDRTGATSSSSSSSEADPPLTRFTSFVRSVKARLLQDLKLLPLRNPETDGAIDRQNLTLYTDEPAGQVLLVYTPEQGQQLEFISFSLP